MEAIERTLATLESSHDKDGYTFAEHLTQMLDRLLSSPGEYPLDKFEELSYLIKLTRMKVKQPLSDKEVLAMVAKSSELQRWVARYLDRVRLVAPAHDFA